MPPNGIWNSENIWKMSSEHHLKYGVCHTCNSSALTDTTQLPPLALYTFFPPSMFCIVPVPVIFSVGKGGRGCFILMPKNVFTYLYICLWTYNIPGTYIYIVSDKTPLGATWHLVDGGADVDSTSVPLSVWWLPPKVSHHSN